MSVVSTQAGPPKKLYVLIMVWLSGAGRAKPAKFGRHFIMILLDVNCVAWVIYTKIMFDSCTCRQCVPGPFLEGLGTRLVATITKVLKQEDDNKQPCLQHTSDIPFNTFVMVDTTPIPTDPFYFSYHLCIFFTKINVPSSLCLTSSSTSVEQSRCTSCRLVMAGSPRRVFFRPRMNSALDILMYHEHKYMFTNFSALYMSHFCLNKQTSLNLYE